MARFLKVSLLAASMLAGVQAFAQAPKQYGAPIGIDSAKKAAAAAVAVAQKNGWYMAIAVVDPDGALVYFERMDNTQSASITVAQDKARTAAMFKRPSKVFHDAVGNGGGGLRVLALPNAIPIEGGIPLMVDDKIIGAIGVSGDSSDHDVLCAQAGVDAVK
jgi:glc operon protein GlcG